MTSRGKKNIDNDLANVEEPDDIKQAASILYCSMNVGSLRNLNRKKAVCYCLCMAHRNTGDKIDPLIIGKKLGLDKTQVKSAFSMFANKIPQDLSTDTGYMSIEDTIDCYSENVNLTKFAIEGSKSLWKLIAEKEPDLEEITGNNRLLTASVIWLYVKMNNPRANLNDDYASKFNVKEVSMLNLYDKLSQINLDRLP